MGEEDGGDGDVEGGDAGVGAGVEAGVSGQLVARAIKVGRTLSFLSLSISTTE